MKSCATCKHWGASDDDWREAYDTRPKAWKRCVAVPMAEDVARWVPGEGHVVDGGATAMTEDAEQFVANLHTAPEHYCSMWEAKG